MSLTIAIVSIVAAFVLGFISALVTLGMIESDNRKHKSPPGSWRPPTNESK